MHLYLDSFGAFLGLREGLFWVKPKDRPPSSFAVRTVHTIYLTRGVRVSTDALLVALEQQIPVLLLDRVGRSVGQVWSGRYGSIATIRKHQALFVQDAQGWSWMRDTLVRKLDGQAQLLQQLAEQARLTPYQQQAHSHALTTVEAMRQQFLAWSPPEDPSRAAGTFRGWEGTASRAYFFALSQVVPAEYGFEKRVQHPAYDRFNATLNYLYGILYGRLETSLIRAGIDPTMGVLHVDRHQRPTLVYDAIEPYRPWADAVAVQLFLKEDLPLSHFQPTPKNGLWLGTEGKRLVVHAFEHYLNETILHPPKQRRRRFVIDLDSTQLAQALKTFIPL